VAREAVFFPTEPVAAGLASLLPVQKAAAPCPTSTGQAQVVVKEALFSWARLSAKRLAMRVR
jgi:hypothetical protein